MAANPGITEVIMQSVIDRLQAAHGSELDVQFFPQDPFSFHLAHPVGAVLVGYSRSQFGASPSLDATFVERELTIPLTLMFCQLSGADGVIGWLDKLRETLTGFTPTHCDRPLRPVAEQFTDQSPGIWQYAQDWSTRTLQVQAGGFGMDAPLGAPIQSIEFEGEF